MKSALGIVRIEDLYTMIDLERLVEPMKLSERKALVDEDFDKIRPPLEGLVEPLQPLIISTEPQQRVADIVAGDRIGRIERVGPPVVGQAFVQSLQVAQRTRAHLQRQRAIRLQFVAQAEVEKRLLEPLRLMEKDPALICRLPMTRVELKGLLIAQQGIGSSIEGDKNAAEMLP